LFFTEKGRLYWLKVYEIPEGDKNSKGRAIQNLIQIPQDDKVRAVIDIANLDDKEFVQQHYIVLCTSKGIIKKTSLEDFSRPRSTGVNAITIVEGDQLLAAQLTDGSSEVMLAVKSGRAIRFPEDKVRPTGRGAIGVGGIEVDDDKDEVIGMLCVSKADLESKMILVVSEKGFGKKTSVDEYRITNRGGKGVKTISITEKTGNLVGIMTVSDDDDLMITCKSGITIRTSIESIREAGRATQGVKLIRLEEDDAIAAISRIDREEEVDETVAEAEGAGTEGEETSTETTIDGDNPPADINDTPDTDTP
ncbi:MAG: DNA gyrase subunit A, partial [Chitinophagaceae bacterium]|nr:DNA gyrase subunit A [Chitinophagaceae bacterium]